MHARYCDQVLAKFAKAGIDTDGLAAQLQEEGAKAFVKSWNELMECIASKTEALKDHKAKVRTLEKVSLRHNANQKRSDRDEEDRDSVAD
jgi:hypothetical protein